VVDDQKQLQDMYKQGLLARDFVAVVRGQGPRSNGMPELHKLTPVLGALQDQGYRVALVTDGRMSGASGKVPAAIHVWPESSAGGAIGKVRDGDLIELDAEAGILRVQAQDPDWLKRETPKGAAHDAPLGSGRDLFQLFRSHARHAELGGGVFWGDDTDL
jgi:phosphogluconate dehydratase